MFSMIKCIEKIINRIEPELNQLSRFIYENPELGYQEFKACAAHVKLLRKYGFDVEEEYLGLKTAFRAEYNSGKKGATIAYLTEYDALPEIGHGCAHNLSGTISSGSGIVLKSILDEIGGRVIVIGTPAEETEGAKVIMAKNGAFNDVDVAMMAHGSNKHYLSGTSLAVEAIDFTFKGKSAHAAIAPDEGINALDGVIQTFNGINALRQQIKDSARIHGVITNGGVVPNIIPDIAKAEFFVRTTTKTYLDELVTKVINCAKGAAMTTGCELDVFIYDDPYYNMVPNTTLNLLYKKHITAAGVKEISLPNESMGSLDMGNVSHVIPAIHPLFALSEKKLIIHTKEFGAATLEPYAIDQMKKTITALVMTGMNIIERPEILEQIKNDFEKAKLIY